MQHYQNNNSNHRIPDRSLKAIVHDITQKALGRNFIYLHTSARGVFEKHGKQEFSINILDCDSLLTSWRANFLRPRLVEYLLASECQKIIKSSGATRDMVTTASVTFTCAAGGVLGCVAYLELSDGRSAAHVRQKRKV
jgi:hypothetical protein